MDLRTIKKWKKKWKKKWILGFLHQRRPKTKGRSLGAAGPPAHLCAYTQSKSSGALSFCRIFSRNRACSQADPRLGWGSAAAAEGVRGERGKLREPQEAPVSTQPARADDAVCPTILEGLGKVPGPRTDLGTIICRMRAPPTDPGA